MSDSNENAMQMVQLWHKVMLNGEFMVCTERLKGASLIDVNILRLLVDHETMLIRDIGNRLSISPSTLSSAIKRLEKDGLINRHICKEDLRSYSLKLTDDGKDTIKEHFDLEINVINTLLERLESEEERKEFLKLLNKIIR